MPTSKLPDGDDQDFHRPKTAPNNIYRSPTHPHFKEDVYRQSRVIIRYDGPGEADLDEVVVQQQPRGTYTLPVFKGMLSVGGNKSTIPILLLMMLLQMNFGLYHVELMVIHGALQSLSTRGLM